MHGSDRNKHLFQENLTVNTRKLICKGTDKRTARSSENRRTGKDRLHVIFSRQEPIEPARRNC